MNHQETASDFQAAVDAAQAAAALDEASPGKGKKPKKEKAPKLDAEGNPIVKAPRAPKLDADGNPIPKKEPVKIDDTNIICLPKNDDGSFKANPKRANSNANAMFELYRDGMTVKEYVEAGGGRDWVRWDLSKGYITLG
jgi:hypothetical protein